MADMASLQRQRDDCYRRLSEYIEQQQQNERKLARLRNAKEKVATEKKRVKTERKQILKKPGSYKSTWRGDEFHWITDKTDGDLAVSTRMFIASVDEALDDICDAITRLENENFHLGILADGIHDTLNNIGNDIEKLLN